MQNIQVKRYDQTVRYQASIAPDDGAWVLFIDSAGKPSLWVRSGEQAADGKTEQDYVQAAQG